jgi:hypothetical protein
MVRLSRQTRAWNAGYSDGYHDAVRHTLAMLPLNMTREERTEMLMRMEERWLKQGRN